MDVTRARPLGCGFMGTTNVALDRSAKNVKMRLVFPPNVVPRRMNHFAGRESFSCQSGALKAIGTTPS